MRGCIDDGLDGEVFRHNELRRSLSLFTHLDHVFDEIFGCFYLNRKKGNASPKKNAP